MSPNVGTEGSDVDIKTTVPADLHQCTECGLLQIVAVIDPAFQYNHFKYTTAISVGLPEHFRQSATEILNKVGWASSAGRLLEIGSNDGTLLRAFQERDWKVLGIDPATYATDVALSRGVPAIKGFFGSETAQTVVEKLGPAEIVIANNTLANIDDLDDFAAGLKVVLASDGIFTFETSYGADVVLNNLFDTIYHEHLSYFMVKPLADFFSRHDFELFDVQRIPTKGGSIRGFVQHSAGSRSVSNNVGLLIRHEEEASLYTQTSYGQLADKIAAMQHGLESAIAAAKKKKLLIAAYGASVGCVTLINQLGIGGDITRIYDDHPLLDVVSGPDFTIPVVRSDTLEEDSPGLVIVLAWRYADKIVERHAGYLKAGGNFIMPLPEVSIQ